MSWADRGHPWPQQLPTDKEATSWAWELAGAAEGKELRLHRKRFANEEAVSQQELFSAWGATEAAQKLATTRTTEAN